MTWRSCADGWDRQPVPRDECDFYHLLDGMMGSDAPTGQMSIVMACLARYCTMKRVVELGVWKGGTTVLLADAMRSTGGLCVCVDANESTEARARLDRLGLNQWCRFYQGKTWEVASSYDGTPIDLLFIDAGHSLEEVFSDWAAWAVLVRPGGWIFMDNSYTERGVLEFLARSIDAIKEQYQFINVPESYGTAIFRKREGPDAEVMAERLTRPLPRIHK